MMNKERGQGGKTFCQIFWMHFGIMFYKRFKYVSRDKKSLFCEIIIPSIMLVIACFMTGLASKKNAPAISFSDDMLTSPITIPWASKSGVDATKLESLFTSPTYELEKFPSASVTAFEHDFFLTRGYRDPDAYGAYFINQMSSSSASPYLDYSMLVNTTAKEAAPYFLNRMAEKAI